MQSFANDSNWPNVDSFTFRVNVCNQQLGECLDRWRDRFPKSFSWILETRGGAINITAEMKPFGVNHVTPLFTTLKIIFKILPPQTRMDASVVFTTLLTGLRL